ncbi:Uncharacterised protein [uncultured Oscillibacter sp.]|jgi:hypothetical protein|uniref:hypothetical protein n=1 Tax=unclassified Oscillibacter TaxID=2629304 RepID=UPI0004706919|nr:MULTISPECIES: hypothetical protein [unclassified Oscillibacter]MUU10800.1 hypothetical protein [Oscillibacter sp.]SCI06438.1 Uncharacterised protein [uncultured Oscillibacter sp.]
MARSVKRVVLVLLAAAVLAFAAWMLWPRSLGDALELEDSGLSAVILTAHVRNGKAYQEQEDYTLPAGSDQAETVLDLLNQYSYHLCWDSLSDPSGISSGTTSIHLAGGRELQTLVVQNGSGKMLLNGRVVRIGYFGSGQAAALCEQLSAILRGESGVAN